MKYLLLLLALLATLALSAQSDKAAIGATVHELFDAMRFSDASRIRAVFLPSARMESVATDHKGQLKRKTSNVDDFVGQFSETKPGEVDERLHSMDIRQDGGLASVWAPYSFYYQGKLLHCGVNALHLVRTSDGWRISQVTDTRQESDCVDAAISNMIDDWHRAAATADADAFFGAMTADAIYLGTDATERWLRDELRQWASSAFERETAWDFTPSQRQIYVADEGRIAWWEELLDTWMGTARGSGIAVLTDDGWKIKHYNLAPLVPNDKINKFRRLVGATKKRG